MDLWATLGISREAGLAVALAGLAFAALLGIRLILRGSRGKEDASLRLTKQG